MLHSHIFVLIISFWGLSFSFPFFLICESLCAIHGFIITILLVIQRSEIIYLFEILCNRQQIFNPVDTEMMI